VLLAASHTAAQNTTANKGGGLAFGRPNTPPGSFLELRDIKVDAAGTRVRRFSFR
jgi:hypothetical protein